MTLRICIAFTLASAVYAQAPACVAVEGDHVLAGDLAPVIPAFGTIAADTSLAHSPLPGVRRVLRGFELAALAKRYGLDAGAPGDLCLERRMETLDRDRVLEAMRLALAVPDARMEIVETSLYRIPRGRIEFRREGLGTPALPDAPAPVIWHGNVVYGDNHRFSIWARVLISASMPRIVTAANLKRGEPIQAAQVRVESVDGFPVRGDVAQEIGQVLGRVPLRDITPGKEVHLSQLTVAPDISRGDMVDVEVISGGARIAFTAKAESSGRSGQTIAIRNPSSNKIFQARVDGKGKAVLDTGHSRGN